MCFFHTLASQHSQDDPRINKHGGVNGRQNQWIKVKYLAREKKLRQTTIHSNVDFYKAFIKATLVLGMGCQYTRRQCSNCFPLYLAFGCNP